MPRRASSTSLHRAARCSSASPSPATTGSNVSEAAMGGSTGQMPIPLSRRLAGAILAVVLAALGCRTAAPLPPAAAIVEGRTAIPAGTDTVADGSTVRVTRATWPVRTPITAAPQDFWADIATLDVQAAQ